MAIIGSSSRVEYPSVEACVDHQVQRSLRNLGVETIDLMQLHGAPTGELFDRMTEALSGHVDAGRIRYLGASCSGQDIPRLAAAGYRPNPPSNGERKIARGVSKDAYDLHDDFGRVCPSLEALAHASCQGSDSAPMPARRTPSSRPRTGWSKPPAGRQPRPTHDT